MGKKVEKNNVTLMKRISVLSLSAMLTFGSLPVSVFAAGTGGEITDTAARVLADGENRVANITTISPETDLTMGTKSVLVDNDRGGKAVHINTSWVDTKSEDPLTTSAAFKDTAVFQKTEFTLYMNVYRLENGGNANNASKVAFSVGNNSNYFNLRLVGTGSLTGSGISGSANFTSNPTTDRKFSSVALSYKEDSSSGKVSVYIDGIKVLDQVDVKFKLSSITDLKANIGSGRGTGFMVEGVYDDIRISDSAVTGDSIEMESRYQPYSTFSGVKTSYGGTLGSSVKVAEWLDTNGEHIQAHGGQVQWLDTLDLNEDGVAEGGWIWYGEDKTRNGKPIDGIHCYTSSDLYNWTDRGMALYTHDVLPDKMNTAGDGVEPNTENLAQLKAWANMSAPSESVTQEQITMAKNFVSAYKTTTGYDEENLAKAFKYLYSGYCIAERPKMLYNENTQKYILVYHADGPSDANILKYLKDSSASPSRYTRASMGFAVSDTPYGPFKLVNVQRMNYKTGGNYDTNQGMARDMTVFIDDTDVNKDGVRDAYAIYSSESNKYMYISLLNSDYTGPITEGTTDTKTLSDGTFIKTFADRVLGTAENKEAPAIFKYNGYYYMITSGTSGWVANKASYFRAENIYGPWTELGDPCEGGSNDTFVSQPTAVIPIDASKGKFIYMGDRWSYTISSGSGASAVTDSAHWDTGYVWLPIDINDDDTITIRNASDWSLSDLQEKPVINTTLPKVISSVAELPSSINVTTGGSTVDTRVVWSPVENSDFSIKTVTGTMTDLDNSEVRIKVAVAPKNMIYFVDAGTESENGGAFYRRVKESSTLVNTQASDQPYNAENHWGYLGNNTAQRNLSSDDHYEKLRYVSDKEDRTLTYQFDNLPSGTYSVYLGFYDPSSWYKEGKRVATVALKQMDTVLKTGEVTCGGKGSGMVSKYENLELTGTDSFQISLVPKNTDEGSDVQISWIAIVDNTVREPDPTTYTITYVLDGGINAPSNPAEYDGKTAVTLADASKEGYTFKGWYTDSACTEANKITVIEAGRNENLTLYAKFEENGQEPPVTEDKKVTGIKLSVSSQQLLRSQSLSITANVEPADAKDSSITWSTSDARVATVDQTGKVTAMAGGTAVITATANDGSGVSVSCTITVPYTITYQLNGGTNNSGNPATYFNQNITLKNPTRNGYTFGGWYADSNFKTKVTAIAQNSKQDITLYAKWTLNVKAATLKSVKNVSGKKAKVTIKKMSGAIQYKVMYSTDKKFKKNKKTKTTKKTSITLTKLKKGKTYYVKVCACKKDAAGKKVWGPYGGYKKVKIKK